MLQQESTTVVCHADAASAYTFIDKPLLIPYMWDSMISCDQDVRDNAFNK